MRHVNFTYNLDCTFAEGADHRMCKLAREAGKNIDGCYYPKETGIYLSWSLDGKYYKEFTGQRIKPVEWDWRLKLPVRRHANYLELSVLLKTILSRIQREFMNMRSNDMAITPGSVRDMVRSYIHCNHGAPENGLFWRVFDEFLHEKALLSSPATIAKYKTLQKNLQVLERKNPLTFEAVDMRWYADFMVHCVGRGFLTNTTGKLIAIMKAFMNWAYDRKYHRNLDFKRFKAEFETTDPIFLTMEELRAIENFEPGANGSVRISQDIFLTGCFTGQRISDLVRMKKKDLKSSGDGEAYWEVHQLKGRKLVRVYLINKARNILEKYLCGKGNEDCVFPGQSPVITNRNLKKIGKAAGLTSLVTKVNYCGNKKLEATRPKYMFLTTHVARKTFTSLLCGSNMPDHEIQSMTGHASSREMKVYKGIDRTSVRNQLIRLFEPISIIKSA